MPLWDQLAGLDVRVDGYALQRRELPRDGWTRVTTTVVLDGDGETGEGEDVTYDAAAHDDFPAELMLAGTWSVDDLSCHLDGFELPDYRRWAFESAALDLALRQAGRSLGDAIGRSYRPVRFVASTRSDVGPWLENDPELEFKLDATQDWDEPLMRRLAALDRVRVVDLKAYYRGTQVDLAPDPVLYRAISDAFPDTVIEDAWVEDGCLEALRGAEDRLSFDAPIHSLADVDARVHLVRAFVRQHGLEVVHVADDGILERDPVSAEDRPRAASDLERAAHVPHLPHAHVLGPERALVLLAAEVERDERGAVDLERHLRQLLLRQLVAGDRLAEDDSLLRILERGLEARAAGADRAPHDPVAGFAQAGKRPAQRRHLRKAALLRHAHVAEHELGCHGRAQRHLVLHLRRLEAGHPALDEEPVDLSVLGARPDDGDVGDRAVRDPHLRAVEDPVGSVTAGRRPHRSGVGAGVGLGQPEAADGVALVHRRQPALLLLLGAPAPDREHREGPLHGHEAADAGVAGLELHAREAVRDGARAGETVALEMHAEEPELRQLLHELARQDRLLEPLTDLREHPLAHELPHRVADGAFLVVEEGVDREEVAGIERGRLGGGGHAEILVRGCQMDERELEPRRGVPLPEALVVPARVRAEDVRDAGLPELLVERLVLVVEAPVAAPDVERDEDLRRLQRRANGRKHLVHVRVRSEVERLRAGRVGGVEVTTPRFDHRELPEVVEGELHGAVPAGGDADERAAGTRADRPETGVDDTRQLGCDCGRPAVTRAAVGVLGIGLACACALRHDDDRRAVDGVEGALHEAERRVCGCGRRQPVQDVEHRVARGARFVPAGQIHLEVQAAADGGGREARVQAPLPGPCRGRAEKGSGRCACQGETGEFHRQSNNAQRALNVTTLHTGTCGVIGSGSPAPLRPRSPWAPSRRLSRWV